jgi:hypothetical protein
MLEKVPHMSITIHDQISVQRDPNTNTRLLDALRVTWRRWRSHVPKASTLLTGPLVLLAMVACDSASRPDTAVQAASACPGSVSLAWSITSSSGQPLTCAQAGAANVALRLQSRTGGVPVFIAFPCTSSPGTANVTPGLYDVAIELRDASGARLATAPPQTSVAVAVGRTKVLTPVTFAVGNGGGGNARVALTLEAENFTSNCQPSSLGGAGITGMTITIARNGGGCAPAVLVRSRGGTQIGTYQVNCSSPEVATCIERDETLTTTGLAPNAYVVQVRGKLGAADCWAADSQLDVPVSGQLQTRIVLRRHSTPGC